MDDMRRARHDLRHHIVLLNQVKQTGDFSLIDKLIESYLAPVLHDQPLTYCLNDTANAVIVYYSDTALSYGIDMTVKLNLPESCFIDTPDLAVILGNILENAVEACKMVDKDRFITVTGEYAQETAKPAKLSLIVKHNYKIEPHTNEDGGSYLQSIRETESVSAPSIISWKDTVEIAHSFRITGYSPYRFLYLNNIFSVVWNGVTKTLFLTLFS